MIRVGSGGGGGASLIINTTTISGGTSGRILYDAGGVVGESANLTFGTAAGQGVFIGAGIAATDVNALSISQTWNNAAITFTADKLNVTASAFNAASLLIDRQVGGASRFSVDNTGKMVLQNATSQPIELIPVAGGSSFIRGVALNLGSANNTSSNNIANLFLTDTANVAWRGDTNISRVSAGVVGVGTGAAASVAGTLSAAAYISGGSAGVDFGPGVLTSVTFKKGIAIAAS